MTLVIDPATSQRRNALILLNELLGELGFDPTTSVADSNQTVRAVFRALNSTGEDLARQTLWGELVRTLTLTTVIGQREYSLPEDWGRPLSDTAWGGKQKFRGPTTGSEWQASVSGGGTAGGSYRYRFFGGQVHLDPAPASVLTFTQEYLSRNWVVGVPGGQTLAQEGKLRFTANNDYSLLDERMLVLGATVNFLESKGLDAASPRRRFESAFELAMTASNGAPILPLVGLPARILLSCDNIPSDGYGGSNSQDWV